MKIRYFIRQFVAILCFCIVLLPQFGCQSPRRNSDLRISSELQTFAVSMATPQGAPYDRAAISQLAPVAADAVVSSMTTKGYREVPVESADLLVRLGGKFSPDFKAEYTQMTGVLTSTVTPESAQHRVLLIEILDRRNQTVLWSDSRTASGNAALPPARLRAVVAEMLRPFPSAIAPSAK